MFDFFRVMVRAIRSMRGGKGGVFAPLIALGLFASALTHAELTIDITTEGGKQVPLAIPGFQREVLLAQGITPVIAADLTRSGLFRTVDSGGLASPPVTISGDSVIADWRGKGADYLVSGAVNVLPDGRVEVKMGLYDLVTRGQKITLSDTVAVGELRKLAHRFSDAIYESLTGEKGVFSTHIGYVVKSGRKHYELRVSDADGFDEQQVLATDQPILSPRWAPDGKRMAYVSFELRKPMVVVQSLYTGKRRIVANFKGNNSAPAWSPDGKNLAITLSKDGISQIYLIDAEGSKPPKRLMTSAGIDTEPAFLPDNSGIYFTSDRGGTPQIYQLDFASGEAKRVTFSGSYNVSPRPSPDGKRLVYIQRDDGQFRVVSMDLSSKITQILTDTTADESPTFSPNGRMILYATRVGGRGVLATVSVDGRTKQKFSAKSGDVYEPVWGPLGATGK